MNLLYILFLLVSHPIHLSKCQMEVNQESRHMEITLHVFIDDLQEIIQSNGSPELFLATESEITNADSFIFNYLTQHLIITNGNKQVPLQWVGKEMSDDLMAFWCYIESEEINESKVLQVEYSVLHDLYDDQQNILNVISSEGESFYYLCKKDDGPVTIE